MKSGPYWLNGFTTAAFLAALMVIGRGLWYHNQDWILPGILIGFFSLVFFAGSVSEITTK